MPGAELVEDKGNNTYIGRMNVKLGPVAVQFLGNVTIDSIDPASHTASAKAQGSETKARGGASATTKFSVKSVGEGKSQVDIETDLQLSGMVAQYGRGVGMISALAQQIIDQFAASLSKRIQSSSTAVTATTSSSDNLTAPAALSVFSVVIGAFKTWVRTIFSSNREAK